MSGEEIVLAIADTIERTCLNGEWWSWEQLVANLRETAHGIGYSDWEDRMGDDL